MVCCYMSKEGIVEISDLDKPIHIIAYHVYLIYVYSIINKFSV